MPYELSSYRHGDEARPFQPISAKPPALLSASSLPALPPPGPWLLPRIDGEPLAMRRRSTPTAGSQCGLPTSLGSRITMASLIQTLAAAEYLNLRHAAHAHGVAQSSVSAREGAGGRPWHPPVRAPCVGRPTDHSQTPLRRADRGNRTVSFAEAAVTRRATAHSEDQNFRGRNCRDVRTHVTSRKNSRSAVLLYLHATLLRL